MVDRKLSYKPDFAIHPGETLRESLDFLGMSQIELSQRTGLSQKHISQIMNHLEPISPETAIKLERVLNIPADFWNSLQANYQITISRIAAEKALDKEIDLAKMYDYNELSYYKLVPQVPSKNWVEKANNLLSYFQVDSLIYVSQIENIAFKKVKGNFNQESLSSWLRFGEIESDKIKANQFDEKKIKEIIPQLKKLTFFSNDFYKKMQGMCAECGIKVVYTPYFKKTKVNGAVRWVKDNPLIQLNSRGTYRDIFWFTFFHEIGHILLHGVKEKFLDFDGNNLDDKEKEANAYAQNLLIPNEKFRDFSKKRSITIGEAREFSESMGVSIDVLMGRFCHERLLSWADGQKFRKSLPQNEFIA